MNEKLFPIIIGAAQYKQPKKISQPLDPLGLMTKTCQMAIKEVRIDRIRDFIDSVYIININSWSYEDAPDELSKILGIKPIRKGYLPDRGYMPQMLVNRAAKAIASGTSQAVLITGGEALYSTYRAKRGKTTLNWPERKKPKYMEGDLWDGINDFTNKYEFKFPPNAYAILETAVRANSSRGIEEHREYIGKLFEHFSKVASKNPYAWTQKSYTAEEITSPTTKNRYISYPYTKRMCSNMFVDQSGALIMTSEKIAEELGIEHKLWIYLMGGADIKNIHNITQRPQLHNSPAAREGSRLALDQAGLKLEDINAFDIYSCFPSIVQIIRNEIGLSEEDPRSLTITGGLPYFGGPWSNYSTHGIITAVELIRKNPSLKIMVVANGGYNTKQSFGIYGTEPPVKSWDKRDDIGIQQSILANSLPEPVEEANGQLTVEAYTIIHDRTGKPKQGIAIGRLENGRRTLANIIAKSELLLKLEQQELVGQEFPVRFDSNIGLNLIIISD